MRPFRESCDWRLQRSAIEFRLRRPASTPVIATEGRNELPDSQFANRGTNRVPATSHSLTLTDEKPAEVIGER